MPDKRQTDSNRPPSQPMCEVVQAALEDAKGDNIVVLDVRTLTDITDYMVVASGASERHIKTLAERVLERMREAGWKHLGVEGLDGADWVLVDFIDVVVHIMRPPTRERYNLEGLWDANLSQLLTPGKNAADGGV